MSVKKLLLVMIVLLCVPLVLGVTITNSTISSTNAGSVFVNGSMSIQQLDTNSSTMTLLNMTSASRFDNTAGSTSTLWFTGELTPYNTFITNGDTSSVSSVTTPSSIGIASGSYVTFGPYTTPSPGGGGGGGSGNGDITCPNGYVRDGLECVPNNSITTPPITNKQNKNNEEQKKDTIQSLSSILNPKNNHDQLSNGGISNVFGQKKEEIKEGINNSYQKIKNVIKNPLVLLLLGVVVFFFIIPYGKMLRKRLIKW